MCVALHPTQLMGTAASETESGADAKPLKLNLFHDASFATGSSGAGAKGLGSPGHVNTITIDAGSSRKTAATMMAGTLAD